MSQINPDSSRPRPPRAPRLEDSIDSVEGRRPPQGPARDAERRDGERPEQEGTFPRDEFRRGHRPGGFGPQGHPHGPHGGPRPGEGPMRRPAAPDPAKMAEQLVSEADANGDGMLTADELKAFFQERESERQAPPAEQTAQTPEAATLVAQPVALDEGATVSDILSSGLAATGDVAEPTVETEAVETGTADPAAIREEVLAWLAAIEQDPQYASLSEEQQAQFKAAGEAIGALDPADPTFAESLQSLLQSYGLAE